MTNARRARPASPLALDAAAADELTKCAALLERPFTETMTLEGAQVEVWVKRPRRPPEPKLAWQVGSGFLLEMRGEAFLVTAGHVARRMDRRTQLSLRNKGGRALVLPLGALLWRRGVRDPWVHHATADVAVARIASPPRVLRGRFLPGDLLVARRAAPSGALELMIVGYPLGLVDRGRFAPIAKRAHAASPLLRLRGEEMEGPAEFFLLDQPTTGGYSGAPVLVAPGHPTEPARCFGVISQTIADESGAQFAAVAPSLAIAETLARERRLRRRPRPQTTKPPIARGL